MDDAAERVRAMLRKPYARLFGFELVEAKAGAVTLGLPYRESLGHAPDWFEGVVTSAIATLAASYSGNTAATAGWGHLVIEQSVQFVGPASGDRLVALGEVIAAGKTISHCASQTFVERDGARHLCARSALTMRHLPPRD
ncbi:MAG: PaaI family thioesterase [Sphingomonadaceae bacterium]